MRTAFINLIFVLLMLFGCGVMPSFNCPPKCGCEQKENGYSVKCVNKGLKSPVNPNDLPDDTFELILSGNELDKIEPDAFSGLNRLTKLDLSGNKLSLLDEGVFRKLKNIKMIDVSRNQLFMLNKTQFYECRSLRTIDLSSNRLTLLPDGLFNSLDKLQKINKLWKKLREFTMGSAEEGNLSNEGLAKMVITLTFTMTRIEDNANKLVQFMRQLILTFDKVILLMHNNLKAEHEAVKDMLNKIVQPYNHQLSDTTKHLVKKKKTKSEHC
ncbi:Leucine-rich repeat-containing protein 3 [Stylophora pistillata]|uniref:Leucine-rich repeat-containing protein 3 n=1 Tax=Stylophora pistillata TaxID=50429 RepID=A0A2B4SIJ0_STYPI|nr:Leucine-rich repeat-containing protein 3 [Stylophora pistillata]